MSEVTLFAFEVPTPLGKFRIIGPAELTPEEAAKAAAIISRVLPLIVVGREPEPVEEWVPQNDPDVLAMQHRFRPCATCGNSPDVHNPNRGADFIGHEYA